MKYFHYIVIIDVAKKPYVYHYSSDDYSEVSAAREIFINSLHGLRKMFGMHMLTTDAASFESVQLMDPYFKGMTVIDDLDEFREKYLLYLDEIGWLEKKA
ncbi:hypothetical protein ACFQAV_11000 [Companilactobacillus huachuanensis]|uniref:Uncharacterized protein n=1 Tax=Companilactobacillus huachuanensis TaxID=2559914 RepID=A0ABW1RMP8_9LACO|nr:hypothetical protein [Companilactobacillus huachuanensis]